jgi:hypothetical protein
MTTSTVPESAPPRRRRPVAPTRFAPWWAAVLLDFVCILAFVLGGKESHNITEGFVWIFEVVFPLTVGFFVPAAAFQLYRKPTNAWLRLMGSILVGVVLWGAIRYLFFDRYFFSVSNVVGAAFLLATMGGWRLVARGVQRARARQ